MSAELLREWRPDFRLDLAGVLAPLRRGRGDPTWRSGDGPPDEDRAPGFGSAVWRTGTTPEDQRWMRILQRMRQRPGGLQPIVRPVERDLVFIPILYVVVQTLRGADRPAAATE